MTPTVSPSGNRKRAAGAAESVDGFGPAVVVRQAARISPPRHDRVGRHDVAPPTSMYSMNRSPRPLRARTPPAARSHRRYRRVITVSSFNREARAPGRLDAIQHRRKASIRVSLRNRPVERVEADRNAVEPARRSPGAASASSTPLVVSARSSTQARAAARRRAWGHRDEAAARRRSGHGSPSPRTDRQASELFDVSTSSRGSQGLVLRHAVVAPQIAAVGNRQPQAGQRAPECVREGHAANYRICA
jgi:hypothetical protein